MKFFSISLTLLLLISSGLVQAAEPLVSGSVPAGSTTGVTVEVETVPIDTTSEPAVESFSPIILDVVAVQKNLADQIATSTNDLSVPGVANSAIELQEYAAFLTGANLSVKSLTITNENIKLGFELPAKLFFFIPIHYTAVITVDRSGHLQDFSTPGWLFFAHDDAGATKTVVNTALEKLVTALAESTNPPLSIFLLKQKQLSVTLLALNKLTKW